jgi:hypothetical protein
VWTHWPVPSGYGRSTVDCIGCVGGQMFAIETKAPGKKPTPLQEGELRAIDRAGGDTFVIDSVGSPELIHLEHFLRTYDIELPEEKVA